MDQRTSARFRPSDLALVAGLIACVGLPGVARAGLVMGINDYVQTSASSGTFEVVLSSTDATTHDVAGFSFELSLPASAGVQFSSVSTATTANPYIFDGTGSATVDPGFLLSYDTFPGASFTASDTEFTYPSIAVVPGTSYGLGLVSYIIRSDAPAGTVPIDFVALGTSLSDADGNAIPFGTQGGSIRTSAVPEPSSLVLLAIGTAALATLRVYRRARRPAGRVGPSLTRNP